MVNISDFQMKDVVNIGDGKRLGNIGDLDINLQTGKIEAIIIAGNGKMLGILGREEDTVIPWSNIVQVGEDVILVKYDRASSRTQESLFIPPPDS